jgi:calcineurin-like phosphoesterase family protein
MATFFTADLHFNHLGIIGHANRRDDGGTVFRTVDEMNKWMIEVWNDTVKRESDIVWVLGDFAFPYNKAVGGIPPEVLFYKLRGVKHLIVGNHDEKNKTGNLTLPWENKVEKVGGGTVLPYLSTFRDNGRRAELCHYPLETWKNAHRGALMFHGHSHGNLFNKLPHRFDVGIDVFRRPMDFEELWEMSQKQTFKPVDHHSEGLKKEKI